MREKIDQVLFAIGDAMGIDAASPLPMIYSLKNNSLIEGSASDFYQTLNDAQNLVIHGQASPDDAAASEYVRQAEFLLHLLSAIRRKLASGEINIKPR